VGKQNYIEDLLAKDWFAEVSAEVCKIELAPDLQKYTTDNLLDLAYTIASGTSKLVEALEEKRNQQQLKRLAEHIKWGRWDFISAHIQDGGEITDEVRTFLVDVLNGNGSRLGNRPQSIKTLERHNQITLFVVDAVQGGQSAAQAYRDASERFGGTPENIERICKKRAEYVVNFVQYREWVKQLNVRTRAALQRIMGEIRRRGPPPAKPRYEVSKGALTEHFLTPCLLGTS
jgi:hypothetical protein